MTGKQIKLFLVDGIPGGLTTAEIWVAMRQLHGLDLAARLALNWGNNISRASPRCATGRFSFA